MTKFDILYAKLESDLSFADDAAFVQELRESIQTPAQWAKLCKLYCGAANRLIDFVMQTPVP